MFVWVGVSSAAGDVSDAILAVFKLFVSLAEHSIANIAGTLSSPRSLALLQRLLRITLFPGYYGIDEQVSALALPIWTLLQEEITDLGYLANLDDALAEPVDQSGEVVENAKRLKSLSTELFKALVQGLKLKSTWPKHDELSSNWTKDRVHTFQTQTRVDIGEALLAGYYVCRDELLGDLTKEVMYLVDKPQDCNANFEVRFSLLCKIFIQ